MMLVTGILIWRVEMSSPLFTSSYTYPSLFARVSLITSPLLIDVAQVLHNSSIVHLLKLDWRDLSPGLCVVVKNAGTA
jgi:hypothetical protein